MDNTVIKYSENGLVFVDFEGATEQADLKFFAGEDGCHVFTFKIKPENNIKEMAS